MERTKHRVIILLLLIMIGSELNASFKSEIYRAYVTSKMDLWKSVIDRMNDIPDKSNELILELVNYQYGYIGYCLGFDKKTEAKKYLELARKNIDILKKHSYRLSMLYAYNAAFCGFKMGINILSVPHNGFRSYEYVKKALELDSENYLGYVQYGNIEFYMPKTFGGSKQEGLGYYIRAKEILEKNKDGLKDDWNYMAVLLVIGQSYTYLDDFISAKAVYDYILRLEPNFTYVRDELYPELMKKMRES